MSSSSLSAEELAALRAASASLGVEQGATSAATSGPVRVELAAPDRQIRRRLPVFAHRLGAMLRQHRQIVSTVMRTSLDVTLTEPEILPLAAMAEEVTGWLCGVVVRSKHSGEPLFWVGLPIALGWHLVEIGFGGQPGRPGALLAKRQLTAIERETVGPFLRTAAETTAFLCKLSKLGALQIEPLGFPLKFEGARTAESGARICVQVPMSSGTLPYSFVLLPKALEFVDSDDDRAKAEVAGAARDNLLQHVLDLDVLAEAHLGTAVITMAELCSLAPGQTIWLNQNQGDPIDVLVEGRSKFFAMPMQRAGAVGVAIVKEVS